MSHRILLFDPSGKLPPLFATEKDSSEEAEKTVSEWQNDHLCLAAVIWPVGAELPKGSIDIRAPKMRQTVHHDGQTG